MRDALAARASLLGVLVRVHAVVPLGAGEDWAAGSASSRRRGSGWSRARLSDAGPSGAGAGYGRASSATADEQLLLLDGNH